MVCKYFLLFRRLPVHLVGHFLCCAEGTFSVLYNPTYFFFVVVAYPFGVNPPPKKLLPTPVSGSLPLSFLLGILQFQVYVKF